MICNDLFSLIGVACTPMDDDGQVALIETPFRFHDGDALPIFIEKVGPTMVRFFDEGGVLQHLASRGVDVENSRKLRFMRDIEREHRVTLTDRGDLELLAGVSTAGEAFANYLQAMLSVARWESEHVGTDMAASELLDEVAAALMRRHPSDEVRRDVTMSGISKQRHRVDFVVGRRAIFAIRPHQNSVASVIRKVLDVHSFSDGANYEFEVILDDRQDPEAARDEGHVISTVATVRLMTPLLREAAAVTAH